jgi:hypothetical protein
MKELGLQQKYLKRQVIKPLSIELVKLLMLMRVKASVFVGKVHDFLECRNCIVLQEQLDLERERVTELLQHIIHPAESEESDDKINDGTPMQVRTSKSWNAQKLRLAERSKKAYEKAVENAQRESNSVS